MKIIMGLILCISLLISSVTPAYAATENEKQYGNIDVEYSDNRGNIEQLPVMVKNNHVYANAKVLGERLGYQVADTNNKCVTIYNNQANYLPYGITQFNYNDTKVNHMLYTRMVEDYEAPFPSEKDDKGMWIPLEYSLIILNSSMLIVADVLIIDIPEKNLLDIMMNNTGYLFDWTGDLGYTDYDWKVIGGASHTVNLFNGLLEFDGDSWKQLYQTLALDSSSYDSKFGEELAMLLCTTSDSEFAAEIKKMDKIQDIFLEDGTIGSLLSKSLKAQEMNIETLYKTCEKSFSKVEKGNSKVAAYNKTYNQLERALDKQTWFSVTGEKILDVQKGVSGAVSGLDIGMKIAEVAGYMSEFANQDEFAVQALNKYLKNSLTQTVSSEDMKKSMLEYSDSLQSDVGKYSTKRFFNENLDWFITSGFNIGEALGTQANLELLVWNLASGNIPFLSEGIQAADSFELSLYATIFQADAYQNYLEYRNQILENENMLSPDKLYNLSQYFYIFLKSSYAARDAAIASISGKSKATEDKLQQLLEYQKGKNEEIARSMVMVKDANKDNNQYVYGFLPDDNDKYLEMYDDSKLVGMVKGEANNLEKYFGQKTSKVLEDFSDISDNGSTDGGWEYGNDAVSLGASGDKVDFIMISSKCNYAIDSLYWGMDKEDAFQKLNSDGWSLNEDTGKYYSFTKNGTYTISIFTEDNTIKQITLKASNDKETDKDTDIPDGSEVKVNVNNNLSTEPFTTVEISLKDVGKWNIIYDKNTEGYSNGWSGEAVLADLNKDGRDEVIVKLSYVGSTYGAINVLVYSVDNKGPIEILQINDSTISQYDPALCTCDDMAVKDSVLQIKGAIYGSDEEGMLSLSWNGTSWEY